MVIISSNISSVPFLFLIFSLNLYFNLCIAPELLDILFQVFSLFFFLTFESFYPHILKFRDSFLSYVQSTNEPTQGTLHFFYIFCSLTFLFYSFLGFPSLCLYYPSVLECGVLFFLRTHSMLIIVVLNSWSDSFTIPAISALGSDGYCLQTVSFLFSMPCNFFN